MKLFNSQRHVNGVVFLIMLSFFAFLQYGCGGITVKIDPQAPDLILPRCTVKVVRPGEMRAILEWSKHAIPTKDERVTIPSDMRTSAVVEGFTALDGAYYFCHQFNYSTQKQLTRSAPKPLPDSLFAMSLEDMAKMSRHFINFARFD